MNILQGLSIPQIIYTTDSLYNGKVEVLQVGHTKKIRVDGISQSLNWDAPSCRKLIWGKTADLLKREIPDLSSILILGLGGGTMQHLISKDFEPSPYIVSVELDPVMVDIAKKFFDVDTIPNHRIIVADAFAVVADPAEYDLGKGSFEAVMVDIYIGENFPDLGDSGNFIALLKDMVIPGGLVAFNRIYIESHQEEVDSFVDQVSGFLEDVQTEVIAGYTNSDNILVYGRKKS